MVSFELEKKHHEIIEKFRNFTNEFIVPNRMKYDESTEFPWDIVKEAYKAGLMNGPIPVKYGGNGYSIFESGLGSEELGAGCIGIGICIDANTLALTPMLLAGTEDQQKKFFGDIYEIKTSAIKKGDKYILNGHKRFITNGEVASYHTVFALTDPEKGARSLTAIIVPTDLPGIEIKPRMQKMGQRASVQNEIIYRDVEVPVANRIGEEGHGFLIAMKTFDRTRAGVAALSVGGARFAYETARDWSKKRIQFGKPIASNQAIAFMLADMATEIELARLITWKAGWAYDSGQRDASLLSAMSKLKASDIAMKVATDAVQVMGGEGYSKDYAVEKTMRDVKLCQIYEGTNQVQRIVISKAILK
jgi:acyl-CoA dehydrogenase